MNKFLQKIETALYRLIYQLEKTESSIKRNKSLELFLLLGVSAFIISVIFFYNRLTPRISDDFTYSMIFKTNVRIHSFTDIIHSQIIHYKIWGGRNVVHVIASYLLMKSDLTADILNTLAFAVFLFVVCFHIDKKLIPNLRTLVFVFLTTWILQPAFGEAVLWITGSANYLWGTIIILLFLIPYRIYAGKKRSFIVHASTALCMFLAGIIAGWTNENTGMAMIAMIALLLWKLKTEGLKIPAWAITGLIGALIGWVIMIIAPGNFNRAQEVHVNAIFLEYHFSTNSNLFLYYLGGFNMLTTMLLVLYLYLTNKQKKENLQLFAIYCIGVLIAIYSMIISPQFPPRAWFGIITFNIIACGILLSNLDYSIRLLRFVKFSIFIWATIIFSFSFYEANCDLIRMNKPRKQRDIAIEQAQKDGAKEFLYERYFAKTKFGKDDPNYMTYDMENFYGFKIKYKN